MILMDRIWSRGITKEMEQYRNLANLSKLLASQPLKKMVTQLLVSFSIFSLVFSCSSLCSSPLIYYDKLFYFSHNYLQLLSIAMNKNCIFLICNGILVFVVKTSAIVRSSSGFDLNDMLQNRIGDGLHIDTEYVMVEESTSAASNEEVEKIEPKEEQEIETRDEDEEMNEKEAAEEFDKYLNEKAEQVSISIAESDEEGGISVHEDEENDESEQKNGWIAYDDDDDDDHEQVYAEEDDDETEKLSTEELNRKFEDFIRRMKEEFRINEARQQQLVMVN